MYPEWHLFVVEILLVWYNFVLGSGTAGVEEGVREGVDRVREGVECASDGGVIQAVRSFHNPTREHCLSSGLHLLGYRNSHVL